MDWTGIRAVLFDLDGVITPTADVHMAAWREMFTAYLASHGGSGDYTDADYFAHIDGKPRYDGVRDFLASRGITLPEGAPDDDPSAETVCGLGNRKNDTFNTIIARDGVRAYPGSLALLDDLEARRIAAAVVSSSKNAVAVLKAAGLGERFDVVVDGNIARREDLAWQAGARHVSAGSRATRSPEGVVHGRRGRRVRCPGRPRRRLRPGARSRPRRGRRRAHRGRCRPRRVGSGRSPAMNVDPRELPLDPVDRTRFPVDPWLLIETEPSASDLGKTETLFALGNGYLGMRANPEEGRDSYAHGTFINGFHETWSIHHAEEAFGFAKVGQTIVNVPDAKTMKIYVDDEPLLLTVADLHYYRRELDLRAGELRRDVIWRTPSGKRVSIRSRRMVSFTERHLAIMTLEITMLEGDAPIVVSSQVLNRQDGIDEYAQKARVAEVFDPRKASRFGVRVLEPRSDWHSERRMILGYQTANSGMTLAVGVDHGIETDNEFEELISTEPDLGKKVYRIQARQGRPIVVNKAVAYHSSRGVAVRELVDRCRRTLDRVRQDGFEPYRAAQRQWLDTWWEGCDVEIAEQPAVQQAVRWNLFQLAQAAARADQLGIAAKGVTGSGYEGHYFWDTEAYVVPFLTHTHPALARNALRFRVTMLPKARERARELAQQGALFPWRTINGDEASAYYAAGTAQYHINADIAFALMKYYAVTGDTSFMFREGVQVMVETARLWADLGFWREDRSGERTFHIHGVTGPDEYTTVVNNNLFTNVMARANLWSAATVLEDMAERDPAAYARIRTRLRVSDAEMAEWRECADAMIIPYDEVLGVHPQDEHFLDRELWDLENTPVENRPLLLHYHPLVIYRFQVLKQADVVLALVLQGDQFDGEVKRRDFEYYDPITTGDSTLSALVQSILAAEVGYQDMAMWYFRTGLFVDLADLHNNTSDGVHIASAGGVWTALVRGFGGMRDTDGNLSFDPRLPREWDALAFRVRSRGTLLAVRLEADRIEFRVLDGQEPVAIGVRGREIRVARRRAGERTPGRTRAAAAEPRGPSSGGGQRARRRLGDHRQRARADDGRGFRRPRRVIARRTASGHTQPGHHETPTPRRAVSSCSKSAASSAEVRSAPDDAAATLSHAAMTSRSSRPHSIVTCGGESVVPGREYMSGPGVGAVEAPTRSRSMASRCASTSRNRARPGE